MELKPKHAPNYKHGAWGRNPKLYSVWATMVHRCHDESRPKYKDYGGRGIFVCDEWKDPNTFMDWADNNGYAEGLQIDRVDNDLGYTPDNCRFVTPKENSRNRRNTKKLTINGVTKSVAAWCENKKVSCYTVYWWIKEKGVEYAEKRLSEIA